MKKLTAFLNALVMFITAVFGFVLGIFGPIGMLGDKDGPLPPKFYVAWLIIAVTGFIIPCFLLRFKAYKSAFALSLIGAAAVIALHIYNPVKKAAPLYLPLLGETFLIVLIFIINRPKKPEEKAAPSVLGGVYRYNRKEKK